jgi:hypothetical protein
MADTLVERLRDAGMPEHLGEWSPQEKQALLLEAAERIRLLTRSLEIMNKALDEAGKMITTSAQGDGSGE